MALTMTEREDLETLRSQGRALIRALDDMHARGETFTGRVSLATAALRLLLAPTWPRDDSHGEQASKE